MRSWFSKKTPPVKTPVKTTMEALYDNVVELIQKSKAEKKVVSVEQMAIAIGFKDPINFENEAESRDVMERMQAHIYKVASKSSTESLSTQDETEMRAVNNFVGAVVSAESKAKQKGSDAIARKDEPVKTKPKTRLVDRFGREDFDDDRSTTSSSSSVSLKDDDRGLTGADILAEAPRVTKTAKIVEAPQVETGGRERSSSISDLDDHMGEEVDSVLHEDEVKDEIAKLPIFKKSYNNADLNKMAAKQAAQREAGPVKKPERNPLDSMESGKVGGKWIRMVKLEAVDSLLI